MELGGWKYANVTYQGGNYSIEKLESVLIQCVEAIIGAGVGWSWDESHSPSDARLTSVGNGRFAFLKHSDGTKMCLGHNGGGRNLHHSNYMQWAKVDSDKCGAGILIHQIASGHGDYDFSNATTGLVYPVTELEFIGTVVTYGGYSETNPAGYILKSTENDFVIQSFILKGHDVIFLSKLKQNNRYRLLFVGDFIEPTVAGDENRRLSWNLCYGYTGSDNNEMTYGKVPDASSTGILIGSIYEYQYMMEFYRKNGSKVSFVDSNINGMRYVLSHTDLLNKFPSYRGAEKFVPVFVGMSANTNEGVVPNEGLKGYFRMDSLVTCRGSVPAKTLLDGGNRICLGNGVVIGWDKDNPELDW